MALRFATRSTEKEIMDDLACQGEVINRTLRELDFINRWLGGNAVTINAVEKLIISSGKKELSIADLGCGSGDMLLRVESLGKKHNIKLQMTGIDANPNIVQYAQEHCKRSSEIQIEQLDIFSNAFAGKSFDIIIGTLFFHHFSNPQLVHLLSQLKKQAGVAVVINDIHRHPIAYYSIRFLTSLFSKSPMVKNDAPISVLRAFSTTDLMEIMAMAGILSYILRWKWAFRWQLIIPATLA